MNTNRYKKNQLKYLCTLINSRPEEVEYIISNLDNYYNEWTEKKINSSTGEYKKYKDGTIKDRTIRPSLKRLKEIQTAIKNNILAPIPLPDNIHGGVRGRNNITNAKPHQGKRYKFTTDLQEFYPSVNSDVIYKMYVSQGYSTHVAHWLTKLTSWKYELPQGTPTSTHIANLVFLATDFKLISLCEKHGITYTRYVDDLTFSSPKDFKPQLNEILSIVEGGGFKISFRKTRYSGSQTITGIEVFNNYIDAPQKVIDKASAESGSNSSSKPYSNYLNAIRKTNRSKN